MIISVEFSYTQQTEGIAYYIEVEDTTYLDVVKDTNRSDNNLNPLQVRENEERQKEFRRADIEASVVKTELIFNDKESLYRKRYEDISEEDISSGPKKIKFHSFFEHEFYFSKVEDILVTQINCRGKDFLITTTLENNVWKITDEIKNIKGYNCLKAIKKDSLIIAVVWFTTEIQVHSGPKDLLGLPGLVVRAVVKKNKEDYYSASGYINKELVIELEKVEYKKLRKNDVRRPKKGIVFKDNSEFNDFFKKYFAERSQ